MKLDRQATFVKFQLKFFAGGSIYVFFKKFFPIREILQGFPIQYLNILNTYNYFMGFLDKIKRSIMGVRDKSDEIKDAAARAKRTVDDSVNRTERAVDDSAERIKRAGETTERAVDDSAERIKKAGEKTKDAVDDTEAASDELKKD